MKLKPILLALLFGLLFIASCTEHDFPITPYACDSDDEVSYDANVFPIVENNCAISGCHNGDNGADRNWLVFSNFQNNAADVKDRITRPANAPGHMPASGSISREEIETILCWVEQGAQDN